MDGVAVYVSFAKLPDFVVAARWEPKPAGRSRYYTYSCTPQGEVVFRERAKP